MRPQVRLLGQFQTQPSYTDTAANNDFAVVTLAQPLGRQTGWLGLEFSEAAEMDVDLTTAGARPSLIAKCMIAPKDVVGYVWRAGAPASSKPGVQGCLAWMCSLLSLLPQLRCSHETCCGRH